MLNSKTYLNVPYAEKDTAKELGAKWDAAKKKWYAPGNVDIAHFTRWHTHSTSSEPSSTTRTTKSSASANKVVPGVTTYAKDKNFVAYSGDEPPWDTVE